MRWHHQAVGTGKAGPGRFARARRRLHTLWLCTLGLVGVLPAPHALGFGFDDVTELARSRSERPYVAPDEIPRFLQNLSYDQFRSIRFKPDQSLWRPSSTRFQVMLTAPGRHLNHRVDVHEVNREGVAPIPFDKTQFDFGNEDFAKRIPADLGLAGLRLTYPINDPGIQDQFLVFEGASYFRGVGAGEVFGLSARGLAVDTALPKGEEFPRFTRFWLERPTPWAQVMRLYALLESPSVAGAYQFTLYPGEDTRVEVEVRLFARAPIARLGLAPLTSMFYYGEGMTRPRGQWRPEVHDSDGLLIRAGDDRWTWRPLSNPLRLQQYSFQLDQVRGFGLLQRDQRFAAYEDGEARYERRPSAWVELHSGSGPGRVMLILISTPDETNDNVVAFWTPAETIEAGEMLAFDYSLTFGDSSIPEQPVAHTVNSFVGLGETAPADAGIYRFVVDYAGGALREMDEAAPVVGKVTLSAGAVLLDSYVEYIEASDVWRLSFLVDGPEANGMEINAGLHLDGDAISETWSYHLPAQNSLQAPP